MGNRFKGSVVIVTGAGSTKGAGIGNGKACAVAYAREGASVMLVDLNSEAAELTKRMIDEEGGRSFVFAADVSKAADCEAVVRKCLEKYHQIDVLHNNVGVEPRVLGGIMELDEEDWDRVIDVNLKSMYLMSRAVLPTMMERGKGAIVNISSVGAERFSERGFVYGISKAAVNTFTRALAMNMAAKGVRVNCIMPGIMDTPMAYRKKEWYGGDIEKMRAARNESVPMKRMGEPWDIANTALFLASDDAKYVTGQVIAVDGGFLNKF